MSMATFFGAPNENRVTLIYMANHKSSKRKANRKSSSDISEQSIPFLDEKKARNRNDRRSRGRDSSVKDGGRLKQPTESSSHPTHRA